MERRLTAIAGALLVAVALWEIVASVRAAGAVPGDDAWDEAARVVRADYRPGDLIVFAPSWVDPVGRLHLGDLISLETAGRMDAARFPRIWELSIRGAHAPEVAALEPVATRDGAVTVRRYEQTPATLVADVRDRLGTAIWEGGTGHLEFAEVGFAAHRCIQMTPPPNGAPARVTFPDVPLGDELVGYVGLADVFTRRDDRTAAHFDVLVDGVAKASVTAGVDDGWLRFRVPTSPGTASLTFAATAIGKDKLVCFAAETRR